MKNKLIIKNLSVSVEDNLIIKNLSLEIKRGEVHAIMGPNGSGKSTLAKTLAGHPDYKVGGFDSKVLLNNKDILELEPDKRARAGLFLSFQHPVEVAGVRVEIFLREAYKVAKFPTMSALEFRNYLKQLAEDLSMSPDLIKRGLNENFSGGEKKRLEILQMAVLKPKFAILDETDSGLDVDALKQVANGIKKIISQNDTGVVIITHYQRILEYLKPDFVHIMVNGQIVKSGGKEVVEAIEKSGYKGLDS